MFKQISPQNQQIDGNLCLLKFLVGLQSHSSLWNGVVRPSGVDILVTLAFKFVLKGGIVSTDMILSLHINLNDFHQSMIFFCDLDLYIFPPVSYSNLG